MHTACSGWSVFKADQRQFRDLIVFLQMHMTRKGPGSYQTAQRQFMDLIIGFYSDSGYPTLRWYTFCQRFV